MRLSVIIPVFNERATVLELLRRVAAVDLDKEVVVVDDGSTDGTRELLTGLGDGGPTLVLHAANQGKGAAIRTGLQHVSGDFVLVQDADLEYDPADYRRLLRTQEERGADAVYGSRFARGRPEMTLSHRIGNRLLTGITNALFGSSLTDMETCYKLIRRRVLADIDITADGFSVEPEITAKLLRRGIAIHEVAVGYVGRSFAEGKKISWRDFLSAVWTLLRLRVAG